MVAFKIHVNSKCNSGGSNSKSNCRIGTRLEARINRVKLETSASDRKRCGCCRSGKVIKAKEKVTIITK